VAAYSVEDEELVDPGNAWFAGELAEAVSLADAVSLAEAVSFAEAVSLVEAVSLEVSFVELELSSSKGLREKRISKVVDAGGSWLSSRVTLTV